jgi:hypothetical protein
MATVDSMLEDMAQVVSQADLKGNVFGVITGDFVPHDGKMNV